MKAYASAVGGEILTRDELEKLAMPRLITKIFSQLFFD
jgi:hypothetical protein